MPRMMSSPINYELNKHDYKLAVRYLYIMSKTLGKEWKLFAGF